MPDLFSYSLSDFLLFSPRVYYRLFELRNQALWPVHIPMIGFGLVMIVLSTSLSVKRHSLILASCGAIWLWLAWSFFWQDYASINWAAAYVSGFAAMQGILLVGAGAFAMRFNLAPNNAASSQGSFILLGFAVIGYPFIAPIMGRSWLATEVFGITPDPTAVATLVVLTLSNKRIRWPLMIVPALWCLATGLTLKSMNASDFFVAPFCAVAAVATALKK